MIDKRKNKTGLEKKTWKSGMKFSKVSIIEISSKKEEMTMDCHVNKCIECTVQQCAHHCADSNYCTLDHILVGTHEMNPTVDQCTDCKSFCKK